MTDVLLRAAEMLRSQEHDVYNRRATEEAPPIEETEAFEMAEQLERIAEAPSVDIDNTVLAKGFEEQGRDL